MKIELKLSEKITVTLEGTDGEFTVEFNEADLRVTADMPDSSGREGVIYMEAFGIDDDGAIQGPIGNDDPDELAHAESDMRADEAERLKG
jgi:hypothetical protein